jgi:hypothetical protein
MMKKKIILFGFIGISLPFLLQFLYKKDLLVSHGINTTFGEPIFFLSLVVLLLSLITYKMKEQAFLAWWGFAKWWVWVIIAATFLLNGAPGGGWGINSGVFSFGILFVLYMVLTVVSLWRVGRVWWRG